jgi:hypothetical protein
MMATGLMAAALVAGAAHAAQKAHHLGPTGLLGSVGRGQIRITKVEKGSPAEGKVKVGDVVVGAGGSALGGDVRRAFADAIDRAETREGGGVLTLALKGGRKVELRLEVLGSYSETAPYDCPKTDAIIARAAEHLLKTKKFGRMQIGLIGLLATGEKKYVDAAAEVIRGDEKLLAPDVDAALDDGTMYVTWRWGNACMMLCEYHLMTGDESVLPAIEAYSVAIARGQDAGGIWGHRFAYRKLNRESLGYDGLHGRLPGYAQMNQPSLPLFISMVLARKCGVRDPELEAGIEKAHVYLASHIGKGTFPYGVHGPSGKAYNNNGMSGSAAVAFAIKGNRKGADFFSKLSTTSHGTLEQGHTGYFFKKMWTPLGVAVAGPEAAAAFFKRSRWLHTLNRTWQGGFTYDGGSYRGCSDTGAHLLSYCLGRRALFITGKDADRGLWLKGRGVDETVALSAIDYEKKSDEELLAMFGHPMPQVRVRAIWTLRKREHALLERVKRMARGGTPLERQSAIGYFGYRCPEEVARPMTEYLGSVLRDTGEDAELRATAAYALCWHGEPAHEYFMDMARFVVAEEPGDVLGLIDLDVGRSMTILCKDPYEAKLISDKALFYKAVDKLLDHRRHQGRTCGTQLVANIPIEDFHHVADKLLHISLDNDPTYHSYGFQLLTSNVRLPGSGSAPNRRPRNLRRAPPGP